MFVEVIYRTKKQSSYLCLFPDVLEFFPWCLLCLWKIEIIIINIIWIDHNDVNNNWRV